MGGYSWITGLLLVERSTSRRIEVTTEDCQPRLSDEDPFQWRLLTESLVSLPEGDVFTGLNFTHLQNKSINRSAQQSKMRKCPIEAWDAKLFMKTRQETEAIATVLLRCCAGHHMDIQIVREHMSMSSYIEGQLGRHAVTTKRTLNPLGATFWTSADQEYHANASWVDLGGSSMASFYLAQMDSKGVALPVMPCAGEELRAAQRKCEAHFAEARHADQDFMADCVQDMCAGGAAELEADLFS